jgi:hypothetical protein
MENRAALTTFVAGLAVVLCSLGAGQAAAQLRPDPIDRSRDLSTQPRPTLKTPEQPTERVVPESRQRDPGTGREVVVPQRYDRSSPDRPQQEAPSTTYGTPGSRQPVVRP